MNKEMVLWRVFLNVPNEMMTIVRIVKAHNAEQAGKVALMSYFLDGKATGTKDPIIQQVERFTVF